MKKLILLFFVISCTLHVWSQTFNGTGGAIPSTQTCFTVNVSGVGVINNAYGLASVCINITHAYDEEIEILLMAPDGTRVPLSIQNGGAGRNYTNTCFSATATIPIKNGSAPFTGNFLPEGFLGEVNNGQNANGQWRLCIQDRRNTSNTGSLLNWSLNFNNTPAPPVPAKPPCTTTLVSGTSCSTAPTICDFNGVCGKTLGVKQVWTNSGLEDCFGVQNNTFVKFVASASTASFAVWVSSSTQTAANYVNGGIQMIFFSGTCNTGTVTSFGCYPHILPYMLSRITATGLVVGNTYYLMFDGFNGDVCDFSISANSGVNILNIDPPSAAICEGENVTLKASGGNGVYTWSPASGLSATSGATVTATPALGTHTYRVTSAGVGSCPIFKDVNVTVNAKPVITAQPSNTPQSVCLNGTLNALSVTANAGSGTISYQWYSNTTASTIGGTLIPGATSASYTPSSAAVGTLYYYCVVSNSNSCSVTSNVSGAITINAPLNAPILTVVNVCGSSTITASNYTGTLTWSDGGSGNPRTFNTAGGPYTVTQTLNGCTSAASNAVSAAPSALIAPTLMVVNTCGSSTITASNYTGTLTWSDGGSGNPRTFSTAGGPYTVTQTLNGCTSAASNVVSAAPSTLNAPILTVVNTCGSSTITASNYTGTLTWSDGGSGNPRTFNTAGGPYTVTQTLNGCTSVASNAVSAAPSTLNAPTLTVVNACGSSTITASNYTGTLTWSDGGSGNPRTFTTAGGPYTVTQTLNGCTSAASNAVSAAPSTLNAPTLTVVNACGSSTITASNYTGTLTWSDGGSGNPRTFTTAGGPYTVTQSLNGCTSAASNAVSAAPSTLNAPVLTVVNTCGSSTITASNYTGTLTWSDGGSGNPYQRTFSSAAGPFTVTQTLNGCTSAASNAVSAAPSTLIEPTLMVVNTCGSSTITASNYTGTLTWSDGGSGNPRTFTTAGGPYTVTQTLNGCTSAASNAVSAAPSTLNAPVLTVVNTCGSSIITASNYTGTLTWSDGGSGNPRTFTTAGGPYTVTQTLNGCTSAASNAVSAAPSTLNAPTLTVVNACGSSTITASNYTGTLTWSDGGSGNPRTFTTVGGPYTVTQTLNGCTSAASNAVSAALSTLNAPTLAVVNACGSSTITASNYTGTLTWSDGGSGNPRTFTTAGGPYTVTQTLNGCTSAASTAVSAAPSTLNAPTLAVVNTCGSSTITVSNYTGTLTWSDGGSGNPRTFTTAGGPYTVTQTLNGCTSAASNAVSAAPSTLNVPALAVVNACGSSTITASNYSGTLTWSDGGSGNPRTFTTAGGPYTVTQTSNGCTSGASNAVSAAPSTLNAPTLTVVNACGSSTITASNYTGTLTWSDGSNAPAPRTVTTAATYSVTQAVGNCISASSNTVTTSPIIVPAPALAVTNNCGNSVLTVTGATGSLQWSDGSTAASPRMVNNNGSFSVSQVIGGCKSSPGNVVTANPKAVPVPPQLAVVSSCKNAVLTASAISGQLIWSDGGAGNPRIFTANAGPVSAMQTVNGCTSAASIALYPTLTPEKERNLFGRDTSICPGGSFVLNPGAYAQYLWHDQTTSQTYPATRSGEYAVTVTDNNGCRFTDRINITLLANCTEIFFPSAFTPNRDGLNETFGALGDLRNITAYTLSVFDRYGNRVFTSHDPQIHWDGRYRGNLVSSNNFVWMATYIYKSQARTAKGSVVLIR